MNAHVQITDGTVDAIPTMLFEAGDAVRHDEIEYQWRATSDEYQHFTNVKTGMPVRFTHAVISALMADKKMPMEHLPGHFAGGVHTFKDGGHAFLGDVPEAPQKRADFRHVIVSKILKRERDDRVKMTPYKFRFSRSDKKMKAALYEIVEEMMEEARGTKAWLQYGSKKKKGGLVIPHPRTVRNWLTAFEAENNPLDLVEQKGNRGVNSHFGVEEKVILDDFVRKYASREKGTMLSLYTKMVDHMEGLNENREELGEKLLRIPCLRTFQNRVKRLSEAFVKLGRDGEGKASAEYRALGEGMTVQRALQRVEIDEWKVDWRSLLTLMGVWKKMTKEQKDKVSRERLNITAALDYASKQLLGLHVHREAPSIMTVLATLEMVCMDKSDISAKYGCLERWYQRGTPESMAADSATWYAKQAFRVTLNDLRTRVFLPPAGAASARGTLERFFGMSSGKALEGFSGRTFGSTEEKGDYDADALACLTADEIVAGLMRFYIDVYQNTPHEGLNGETPKEAWKRLTSQHRIRPEPTGRRRRHIFGVNAYRMLGRHGVRFLGIPYQSVALQALLRKKKQKVLIRVDRFDLGAISVWDGEGWVTVAASAPEFRGMNIWTWRATLLELRKLNLESARMSRATLRKARAELEAKGEIMALEAGIDSPILTDERFQAWEKAMDRSIEIVDCGDNVPGDFVTEQVFSTDFYESLGITVVPVLTEEAAKPDPEKGWADPYDEIPGAETGNRKTSITKAKRFNS